MKTKTILIIGLLVVLMAACAGNLTHENLPGDNAAGNDAANIEAESNAEEKAPVEEPEPESEKVIVMVAPELVDCEGGAGPQKCMRVKFEDSDDWQFFYSHIEGFEFVAGFEYTLMVEKFEVENPPADGSSIRYVLVERIAKEAVQMQHSGKLDGGEWKLFSMGSLDNQLPFVTGQEATFMLDSKSGKVAGTTGCNRYNGNVELDLEQQTLTFGPLMTTRMACPDDLSQQEHDFIAILNEVTHFEITAGKLLLLTEGENMLVFRQAE